MRTCPQPGKARYEGKRSADRAVKHIRRDTIEPDTWRAYRCRCGFFHLTTSTATNYVEEDDMTALEPPPRPDPNAFDRAEAQTVPCPRCPAVAYAACGGAVPMHAGGYHAERLQRARQW